MDTSQTPQLDSQKIKAWKIWYSDKTIDSTQMSWEDAPIDDVQVVMIYFEHVDGLKRHTRLYSSGCDFYALSDPENLAEAEFSSSFDDKTQVIGSMKFGKFMNYEALIELEKKAFNDFGVGWLVPEEEVIEKAQDKI